MDAVCLDCQAHLLAPGMTHQERRPDQRHPGTRFTADALPEPVFTRESLARRRSSPAAPRTVPGDQSASPQPRWALCPEDQHLHLLAPVDVATVTSEGHGQAVCGQLISREDLTLQGPSAGFCMACLTAGTPQ